MRDRLRLLPANVWLMGVISLLNDAASELVYPLLPLYLATVLAAGPRALGVIEGAAEATAALLKLASGVGYDRSGRAKPFVVVGYSMAAVARPLIALVTAWPTLLALRVLDRIGKGLRSSPRDALLAASVDGAHRGLAFGIHRAFDNAGAVVGPLLAAALLGAGVPLRDIFLWAGVPGLLCVLLTLALRETPRRAEGRHPEPQTRHPEPPTRHPEPPTRHPEPPTRHPERSEGSRTAPPSPTWRWSTLPPALRHLLVVIAFFALGNSSNAFLLLRAADLGLTPAEVALWWALVSATAVVVGVPLSGWSDRIGRRRPIVVGWVLYAAVYLAMALWADTRTIWWIGIAFGVTIAATEGALRALVADLAPAGLLGTAYGWFYLLNGLMLFPASALFGLIWHTWGAALAFGLGAAVALAAVLLLVLWVPAAGPPPPTPGRRG